MATNERLRRLRFPQRDTVRMSRRALMGTAECGVGFLLGAVLAGAEIFGLYAPFGVAAVAAAGSGLTGLSTLAGELPGLPLPRGHDRRDALRRLRGAGVLRGLCLL